MIPGCEKNHGHIVPVPSETPANFEPVEVGHVDVEDHEVRGRVLDRPECVESVLFRGHPVSGEPQGSGHEVGDRFLVIYDQKPSAPDWELLADKEFLASITCESARSDPQLTMNSLRMR